METVLANYIGTQSIGRCISDEYVRLDYVRGIRDWFWNSCWIALVIVSFFIHDKSNANDIVMNIDQYRTNANALLQDKCWPTTPHLSILFSFLSPPLFAFWLKRKERKRTRTAVFLFHSRQSVTHKCQSQTPIFLLFFSRSIFFSCRVSQERGLLVVENSCL